LKGVKGEKVFISRPRFPTTHPATASVSESCIDTLLKHRPQAASRLPLAEDDDDSSGTGSWWCPGTCHGANNPGQVAATLATNGCPESWRRRNSTKHSRALEAGARVSLLVHDLDTEDVDPLQLSRLTAQVIVEPLERETDEFNAASRVFIAQLLSADLTLHARVGKPSRMSVPLRRSLGVNRGRLKG
jgi:hypothetical protein